MTERPRLRARVGADGVEVWSPEIFGAADSQAVRSFLARAFSVGEVERVELSRSAASGRIIHEAAADPSGIWRKLSRVFGAAAPAATAPGREASGAHFDTAHLYLDGPRTASVRVTRIGEALSTWRVRHLGERLLRVWHPALLNRRDFVFRLEEELAFMFGVEAYRVSAISGGASIRFDATVTTAARIATELEKAWPRLVHGLDGPPSRKRLFVSVGLVGLAYYGQYVSPAVRPFAVAGMALYGLPNLVNAAKDLRHGRVGLPALYSTGLGFMLLSGFPFTASVMAALMQSWSHLTRRKLVTAQRRLFAAQRTRPTWARRLTTDGAFLDVSVDDLHRGHQIVVRSGETIPADGFVTSGSAAVTAAPVTANVENRRGGDRVNAGTVVREGSLIIRVERAGRATSAHHVDALLPRGWLPALASSEEAERVANRNAKPALAAAAIAFTLTQTLPRSQALIRPDYATGLRISAQLSTLRGLAEAWQVGVLFRDPAALDRLPHVDVYVIDDTAGAERQNLGRPTLAALVTQNPKARFVYLSRDSRPATRAVAEALGVEVFHSGLTPTEKLSLLKTLDGRVLWIGDGSDPKAKEILAASSISVSVAPLWRTEGDAADIQLVHTDLTSLPKLIEFGRAHRRRLGSDYRAVHATNLLGAAGAILGSLTALHTGLLSNVSTAFIYARHARALEALARSADAQRAERKFRPI